MKFRQHVSQILVFAFCIYGSTLLGQTNSNSIIPKDQIHQEEKNYTTATVPRFTLQVNLSDRAKATLKKYNEKVVVVAKFEGLRKNGQFAGPEPPKVMSQVIHGGGGDVTIQQFELLDFDKSPLLFGGLMLHATNTQQNTPRLLIKCENISKYPKDPAKLQALLQNKLSIHCTDYSGL